MNQPGEHVSTQKGATELNTEQVEFLKEVVDLCTLLLRGIMTEYIYTTIVIGHILLYVKDSM